MAGDDGHDNHGGGRSYGNGGFGATERFKTNWWGLRLPEEALSTPMCSGATCGCCNRGGDLAGGVERLAPVVDMARGRIRQRGMGETVQRLTAVLLVLLARQGRHGVRRIDGGHHRHLRSRTVALAGKKVVRACVLLLGGAKRRGGVDGHVRRGCGGRWPRLRRSAATATLGCARERDRGEEEHGESEGVGQGAASRLEGVRRKGELANAKQELAQPASCSGSPLPTGRGRRRSCPCGLGLYSAGLASLVAAQVRPGKLSLSSVF